MLDKLNRRTKHASTEAAPDQMHIKNTHTHILSINQEKKTRKHKAGINEVISFITKVQTSEQLSDIEKKNKTYRHIHQCS